MAKPPEKDDDKRSEEETERLRDKVLRRMLQTPPKPQKDKGKSRQNQGDAGGPFKNK